MCVDPSVGHYPDFDVMAQQDHWDPHTREIVEERLQAGAWQVLTLPEVAALHHLCYTLLDDTRDAIITYAVQHFDKSLASDIGEAQRKKGTPKAAVLIRDGLKALDRHCTLAHGCLFAALDGPARYGVLEAMSRDGLQLEGPSGTIPAKELFQKLLAVAVSAYYSHPVIWSEIGYAGPAYPRGYVRSERGLIDPWEAKRSDAQPG
jgi:hypothetical protein